MRFSTPNAGGLGSFPGQGSRSHILQLRECMLRLKVLDAATKILSVAKTQCTRPNAGKQIKREEVKTTDPK